MNLSLTTRQSIQALSPGLHNLHSLVCIRIVYYLYTIIVYQNCILELYTGIVYYLYTICILELYTGIVYQNCILFVYKNCILELYTRIVYYVYTRIVYQNCILCVYYVYTRIVYWNYILIVHWKCILFYTRTVEVAKPQKQNWQQNWPQELKADKFESTIFEGVLTHIKPFEEHFNALKRIVNCSGHDVCRKQYKDLHQQQPHSQNTLISPGNEPILATSQMQQPPLSSRTRAWERGYKCKCLVQ